MRLVGGCGWCGWSVGVEGRASHVFNNRKRRQRYGGESGMGLTTASSARE